MRLADFADCEEFLRWHRKWCRRFGLLALALVLIALWRSWP